MAVVLLDANVVSFLFKRHPLAAGYLPHLRGQAPAVSFMTVAELYVWGHRAHWRPGRFARLEAMLRSYVVLAATPDVCRRWGAVRYERRAQPISVSDAWIAATALHHGMPLITHNPADFTGLAGLSVISAQGP